MSSEEVQKLGKKLDRMVSADGSGQEQALDILKVLKDLPITLDVLHKTRIGMTVNSLRKSSKDEEVITLAKQLIKNWKKLLGPGSSNNSKNEGNKESSVSTNSNKERPSITKSYSQSSFPTMASDTSNAVRLKCRDLLASALKCEVGDLAGRAGDPDHLAALIEDCIFKEIKNTDLKYKNRIRSRVSNLKDPKNPTLRENVLLGGIMPEKIAVMSAEEMASDDMKQLRQKFTKEAINDHQMAVTSGTQTDLLKCPKCKKRNCAYNQVQTRSADEPMTTFALCNDCGQRWKFC